ncbi:MAG TPA: S8 family serine peptidase [Steroidobacteraceae bacterium]
MRSSVLRAPWLAGTLVTVLTAPALLAQGVRTAAPAPHAATGRYIVKLRPSASPAGDMPARLGAVARRAGVSVRDSRHIVSDIQLLRVQLPPGPASAEQTLARLRADRDVEYAETDQRRYPLAVPDDTLFAAGQWYLQSEQPAALDAVDAWEVTTGSTGLVIADLDTGVRFDHPDLRNDVANRLLPGYDMIGADAQGNFLTANDGDGRDPDASDPGDWVSSEDTKNSLFSNCTVGNSSWHGTRTAGILGAITNNAAGIAGTTWSGWILPVRVLGKCGGYDSDILAGMAWAAGMHVDGVPDNPYPAQILNMSLGAVGDCPRDYQQLVAELAAAGVLVVVSAGNEGGPVDAPANCAGAVGVAGLRHIGTKVGFSSLGPEIALSAPAGNCGNTGAGEPCLYSITTTTNTGTTVPSTNTYTNQISFNIGTSFSAPLVAATAGLMLAVNGNLTPAQLIKRLQHGATPFPLSSDPSVPMCHVPASATDLQTSECNCTTAACGAGMANANGAVQQALRPIAAVSAGTHTSGAQVTLDAGGSAAACHDSIVSYQWTSLRPANNTTLIKNPTSAQASLTAPSANSTTYLLQVTVTDDAGRTDSEQVVVSTTKTTPLGATSAGDHACLAPVSYTVPTSGGGSSTPSGAAGGGATGGGATGGGGGGGGMDLFTLLMLVLAYSSRCAASSQVRCARR